MNGTGEGTVSEIVALVKPVFLRWEKLRLVYNAVLVCVTVCVYVPMMGLNVLDPLFLLVLLGAAVVANLIYFAGPVAEAYISWLGFRSAAVTAVLFAGGVMISVPCVVMAFNC